MGGSCKAAVFLVVLLTAPAWSEPRSLRVCDDVKEPISLDPLKEFSEKYYTIIQQIFDSLLRLGPDGRLEPALATSWKWVDPETVELKLRSGVTFHDGEPFDADAVKFSLERFLDPKSAFPGAGFLGSIASVEIVDPLTVRIKTKGPDGILLNRLASLAPMMPPRYIQDKGRDYFGRRPVGTGAFAFERWDDGDRIVLKKNGKWWDEGKASVDRLEFLFLPAERQVDGLLSGQVDVVTELPGTETLRVMKSGVARVIKKETFYTPASSWNAKVGPLADERVRKALNLALNKDDLVRYDVLGNGRPLATMTMPGEIGHDPDLKPYPYDVKKAKVLLEEAGYSKGFHLKALVKMQGARTMRIIAKQLSEVGVTVDVDTTTDTEAVRDMSKKRWDWIFAGCPDPLAHSYFVQFIFLSSLSPFSVTGDKRYDELMADMVGAVEGEEQDRKGRVLDRYVYDHALSLFTYQRVKTYGVRNGVEFTPWVTGMPYFYSSGRKGEGAR